MAIGFSEFLSALQCIVCFHVQLKARLYGDHLYFIDVIKSIL